MNETVAGAFTNGQRCKTAAFITRPIPCSTTAAMTVEHANRRDLTLPVNRWAWWKTAVARYASAAPKKKRVSACMVVLPALTALAPFLGRRTASVQPEHRPHRFDLVVAVAAGRGGSEVDHWLVQELLDHTAHGCFNVLELIR